MKLIQCSKGHYYDSDKYTDCPYCGADTGNLGVTVPLNQGGSPRGEAGVTAPMGQEALASAREAAQPMAQPQPAQAPRQETLQAGSPSMSQSLVRMFPDNPEMAHPRTVDQEPVVPEQISGQWRAPQLQAGDTRPAGPWRVQEDDNRTVSYYSRTIGTEPVVGWLVAIEGNYFGEAFRLKTGRNFIGRSPEMDVQLSLDNSVSRRKHAIIIYEPKARKFIAQPGDSRELFYLNDEVVLNNMVMKAYDVLNIGETKLLLIPLCGERFSWEELQKKQES